MDEARVLTGLNISSVEDLRDVARCIHDTWGCAALVKGGHLRGLDEAVDVFYDGVEEFLLSAPFIKKVSTHGTGCTYSAAITAHLARGSSLVESVKQAKQYISQAIADSKQVGPKGYYSLGW